MPELKAPPPAFLLYAAEFLGITRRMSREGAGAYATVLCDLWLHGPIPDTDEALAGAMGLTTTEPRFVSVRKEVTAVLSLTDRGWIDTRLERRTAELRRLAAEQSRKGRLSGEARRKKRTEHEPRFTNREGTAVPIRLPKKATEPEPHHLGTKDQDQDQDRRAGARQRRQEADENTKVLAALALAVLDEDPSRWTAAADSELTEEVKTRAARASIAYDGAAVGTAVRAARGQAFAAAHGLKRGTR